MVQRFKVFRQVEDNCPCITLSDILFYPENSVFCPSSRTIAKTILRKQRLINWHELLEHCLLDDSVYDGRNAKLTYPSVRLRNFHSSDWKRGIFSLPDFLYQLVVVFLQPQQCRFDCHSIDSRRSLVRLHSSVSSVQVVLFQYLT